MHQGEVHAGGLLDGVGHSIQTAVADSIAGNGGVAAVSHGNMGGNGGIRVLGKVCFRNIQRGLVVQVSALEHIQHFLDAQLFVLVVGYILYAVAKVFPNARRGIVAVILLHHVPDVNFSKEHFLVVSPDEGAMNRNMYYSSVLGCNLGMFYKRRDYSRVVNGRNPIVAHEYLGEDVKGKDVFIADDIIASGESMLDIGYELKMRGAKNIFTCATFPLFTAGLDKFDKAYNDGIIKAVLGTNLTYRKPELLERPWYFDVDLSKYTAYFIAAVNHDMSVSSIIDPMTKIKHLLDNHGIPIGNQE